MKKTSYEIIVKCVLAGAPAMAKEVIDDLNYTLDRFECLTQNNEKATNNEEN